MGTFMGHALPGTFFMIFAIWWLLNIWLRYFRAKQQNKKFKSNATFTCSCLCGRLGTLQLEGFLKAVLCGLGITGEIITGFDDNRKFVHYNNAQHITMYAAFGLSGVVDILVHHNFPCPPGSDYIALLLGIMVEGVLFLFHLHGRSDMDVQVHILLVYVVGVSVVVIILELWRPDSVILALSRTYLCLCQGTWFWQVGAILYPHHVNPNAARWDENDHEQMMITVLIFAWHLIINFMVIVGVGVVINSYVKRSGNCYDVIQMRNLISKDQDGDALHHIGSDDNESDMDLGVPMKPSK